MTRCGPQAEDTLERFVYCYLRIRFHGNACSPKTVVQQRPIPRCQGNVLSEAPPTRRSYSGFQASCHNIVNVCVLIKVPNWVYSFGKVRRLCIYYWWLKFLQVKGQANKLTYVHIHAALWYGLGFLRSPKNSINKNMLLCTTNTQTWSTKWRKYKIVIVTCGVSKKGRR
jgi:hypothetical protein